MTESLLAQEGSVAWRLAASLLVVMLNAFFVTIEFAMVKARPLRMARLAAEGSRSAAAVSRILERLSYYLSSCQLGITVTSLVLGWLAEPAVAALLIGIAGRLGVPALDGPLIHALALGISLGLITIAHMTVGEQVPKLIAIQKAEAASMLFAYPFLAFTVIFRPIIWVISTISATMVRIVGFSSNIEPEGPMEVDELKAIFRASSRAGHITERQGMIGDRVLGLVKREVRHIMVPRVEVIYLSTSKSTEENLATVRSHGHSRFPLCEPDLDSVKGIVHARDLLGVFIRGGSPDLDGLVRSVLSVPDTMPLSRFIVQLQRAQVHCAVVVDEHGTNAGLAFLEDALEEIVGPIPDEFDRMESRVSRNSVGVIEMAGSVSLPQAAETLELDLGDEHDTIGGFVVATLGRLPNSGDTIDAPPYRVTILKTVRGRVARLKFEPVRAPGGS
jgi:CBS domain containing-hemolysin-like protein